MRSCIKFTAVLLLMIFSHTQNVAYSKSDFLISKSLIDIYLWAKFPINKNLFFGELTLSNPNLDLKQDNQIIKLKIDFKVSAPRRTIEGTMDAQASIIYDSKTRFFIMKEPILNNIQLKDEKTSSRQIINNLNTIISESLNNLPIYRLDEKLAIIGKSPNKIEILDAGILLKYE